MPGTNLTREEAQTRARLLDERCKLGTEGHQGSGVDRTRQPLGFRHGVIGARRLRSIAFLIGVASAGQIELFGVGRAPFLPVRIMTIPLACILYEGFTGGLLGVRFLCIHSLSSCFATWRLPVSGVLLCGEDFGRSGIGGIGTLQCGQKSAMQRGQTLQSVAVAKRGALGFEHVVLSGAFLTLAIVMGEFTIASLLNRPAFGPYLQNVGANRAFEPSALAIISFVFTWGAMGMIQLLARFAPKTAGTR
jgi:hypothetical protein